MMPTAQFSILGDSSTYPVGAWDTLRVFVTGGGGYFYSAKFINNFSKFSVCCFSIEEMEWVKFMGVKLYERPKVHYVDLSSFQKKENEMVFSEKYKIWHKKSEDPATKVKSKKKTLPPPKKGIPNKKQVIVRFIINRKKNFLLCSVL